MRRAAHNLIKTTVDCVCGNELEQQWLSEARNLEDVDNESICDNKYVTTAYFQNRQLPLLFSILSMFFIISFVVKSISTMLF